MGGLFLFVDSVKEIGIKYLLFQQGASNKVLKDTFKSCFFATCLLSVDPKLVHHLSWVLLWSGFKKCSCTETKAAIVQRKTVKDLPKP